MTTPAVQAVARVVLAPTLMISAATLVKGYADTGDGFAAGVIAALGLILQYIVFGVREAEARLPLRHAPKVAIAGLLLALAVAFVPVAAGRPPLTHVPGAGEKVAHVGSLELITPVVFDVGVFLLVVGSLVAAVRLLALADDEQAEAEAV
jgi:multicomponent Na+:H+ antiporter subunit B